MQQVQSHLPPRGSATIPGHRTRARKGTSSFQGWQPFRNWRWCLGQYQYRIQVSPWDCTGCELCVRICPADALTLGPAEKVIQEEEANWNFAVTLPDRGDEIDKTTVKGSQFQKPYLEFSGACEGCGETPHVKLMTQLFGDRLVIANATGWNVKVLLFV